MATTRLAQSLASLSAEDRAARLEQTHELHATFAPMWATLLAAFEGTGGFLDGGYLWKYPNEEDADFKNRKAYARYHNYAKSLINLYVRHVFHQKVTRTTENEDLKNWWQNIDGRRTTADTFMKRLLRLSLAMGHGGVLVDKTQEAPTGPSRADEKATVVACIYTPPAILDWRLDLDQIVGLKLRERVDASGILDAPAEQEQAQRFLVWTKDEFARINPDGTVNDGDENVHRLGFVPFAVLRPEPSAEHPFIGLPLLSNGNIFKALYNRCSEEDEVLRNQSFSILTCSVPVDGDIEKARQALGTQVGTTRALVANGQISYVTPDVAVPEGIRKNIAYLVSEIYRMAHVVFQRDSLEAESAEAIALKHTELNEMLTGIALECAAVEMQMAEFVIGWQSASPEAAKAAWDASKTSVTYTREFFVADLLHELEKWANAIRMDLGATMTKRLKKRAVDALEPDLDEVTRKTIEGEIDAMKDEAPRSPAEDLRARSEARMQAFMDARQKVGGADGAEGQAA